MQLIFFFLLSCFVLFPYTYCNLFKKLYEYELHKSHFINDLDSLISEERNAVRIGGQKGAHVMCGPNSDLSKQLSITKSKNVKFSGIGAVRHDEKEVCYVLYGQHIEVQKLLGYVKETRIYIVMLC